MSAVLPVKYPARHYSNADTGAPILASEDGSIKNILKACLVTGYESKESAGWTALFEDSFAIVLRLPENSQSYVMPDVKIENGAGKYRITTQNNPTGLNDASKLATTPLLSKDGTFGQRWHLVATDIGFIFWYAMAESGSGTSGDKGTFISVTLAQALALEDPLFIFYGNTGAKVSATTGVASPWLTEPDIMNMSTGAVMGVPTALKSNISDNGLDIFQYALISKWQPPILSSMQNAVRTGETPILIVDGLRYLRVPFKNGYNFSWREYYIPLDYWEV